MCILITRGGVSYVKKKEKQGPLNITTKKKKEIPSRRLDQKQIEPGAFFLLLLLRPCISIESRSFGERERAIEKSELIRFQGTLVLIYSTYIQEHYRKIYQLNLATTSSPPLFFLADVLKRKERGDRVGFDKELRETQKFYFSYDPL